MHQVRVKIAKNYQKDSYTKTHLMKKNKEDKNLVTKFKKHSYSKICEIVKL